MKSYLLPLTSEHDKISDVKDFISIISKSTLCIYICVSIPLRFAFIPEYEADPNQYTTFFTLDLVSTIFFVGDAIHNAFYGMQGRSLWTSFSRIAPSQQSEFIKEEDQFVHSNQTRTLWRKRLENIFAFFISIPLEYIRLSSDNHTSISTNYLMTNRMLRILYLPNYIENVSTYLENKKILQNTGLHRAWKLFFTMALAGHLCCCGFFFVAKREATLRGSLTWPEEIGLFETHAVYSVLSNEIIRSNWSIEMLTSVHEAYIKSLYWAYITMVTTGFGDIVPVSLLETIWCIFSMLVGVMITSCAIANLQLLVTNMDAALTKFQQKMETIGKYMRYRKLPNELQNRITSFYHYEWDLLKGADEEKFLSELPKSLHQRVTNFMCRDLIASLPVLRKANVALLNALAECAETYIYSPNDDILKPGDKIKGPILVSHGEVEVFMGFRVERKMKRFDRFAEEALFTRKLCDRTVRARTFCEVFLLPAEDFKIIVDAQCDKDHIEQMKETALVMSKSAGKANKMFGLTVDSCPEYTGFEKHYHPDSSFRKLWLIGTLVGYLFYVFSLPLSLMQFLEGRNFSDSVGHLLLSYTIDFFFVIDLYLSSHCFMYFEEGLIISDKDRIRNKYSQTRNIVKDFVASIPIDFCAIILGSRYCHLLRLNKIFRLSMLLPCLDSVEKLIGKSNIGSDLSHLRVIKLNFLLIIVCHWVGCLWHGVGSLGEYFGYSDNWIVSDEENDSLSINHSDLGGLSGYLRSVYWAIVGMSTVGYGDIVPTNLMETTYATVVILFGGLILPAIVGGLAAYIGNLNASIKGHRKRVNAAKRYMKHFRIDKELVDKVIRYYAYLWSRQGGLDEEAIMDELPGPLKERVGKFVNQVLIDTVPFFSVCDESVKQGIVLILKPRVFMPTDIMVHKGEIGTEMFFIEKGKVAVLSSEGLVLCTLGSGAYFGESVLLASTARVYSAKAITYCDTFILHKDDFEAVLEAFATPDVKNLVSSVVESTVMKKVTLNKNISENIRQHPKCVSFLSSDCSSSDVRDEALYSNVTNNTFLPNSTFRFIWNILLVITILYNTWIIPYRFAFESDIVLYQIDWVYDWFLVFDMYMNRNYFAFVHYGEIIHDKGKIRKHYMEGAFRLDLISVIPIDSIAFFAVNSNHKGIIIASLRMLKLLRLRRLPTILKHIFDVLDDYNFNLAPLRLFEFLSGIVLIAHWAACGFYLFARWKNNDVDCTKFSNQGIIQWATEYRECLWKDTWIKKQIINGKLSIDGGKIWQQYIRSFNWALPTLVVVVIGDVVPVTSRETLYVFLWMVVGVSINAAIVGNVANIIANIDTDSSSFMKKADSIKKYMHNHNISEELQNRVNRFLAFLWDHGGTQDEDFFVKDLPYTLQIQVTQETRQKLIRNCPFFDFCSSDIVKSLSLRLKPLLFAIGDILVNYGDVGQEMFFLMRGCVEVLSEDCRTVFATLNANINESVPPNDIIPIFFGETSLFFKRKRTNTIRACSFCEVYQLNKCDLDNELRQREFDLNRMLDVFTSIAEGNEKRNSAVANNLKAAESPTSKLSKLISLDDGKNQKKRVINIFLPGSLFRIGWDFFCIVFTIYFAATLPFRSVFTSSSFLVVKIKAFDLLVDIFFLCDIFLRLTSFPTIQNGSIDVDNISRKYIKNGMYLDIISCLPTEYLFFWVNTTNESQLRLFRLVRILRLPYYFIQADQYLKHWNIHIDIASRLLLKMFFIYALTIHWCGCIWFAIHRFAEAHVKYTWATTDCPGDVEYASAGCLASWIESIGAHDVCHLNLINRCYIRSIYFVFTTMSTVGYGDISPVTSLETIFQNVVVLLGACMLAGIVGAFAEYLSHSDESGTSAYKNKMKKIQEYMDYRKLPAQLQWEILFFHQNKWNYSHSLDEQSVIGMLSQPLQLDLSFEVMGKFIRQVPILSECTDIVQRRISHALIRQVCPPNANIYNVGEIGWDIYFIGSGLIKIQLPSDLGVLDEEGKANFSKIKEKAASIGLLYRAGNHFGESSLISKSGVRQETATATATAELYLISKKSLENIFKYMTPSDSKRLRRNFLQRNGNTWHTFEDDTFTDDVQDIKVHRRQSSVLSKRISMIAKSKKSFLNRRDSNESSTTNYSNSRSRLRSFSAEASAQALLRNSLTTRKPNSAFINSRLPDSLDTTEPCFNELLEEDESSSTSSRFHLTQYDQSSSSKNNDVCSIHEKRTKIWDPGKKE